MFLVITNWSHASSCEACANEYTHHSHVGARVLFSPRSSQESWPKTWAQPYEILCLHSQSASLCGAIWNLSNARSRERSTATRCTTPSSRQSSSSAWTRRQSRAFSVCWRRSKAVLFSRARRTLALSSRYTRRCKRFKVRLDEAMTILFHSWITI